MKATLTAIRDSEPNSIKFGAIKEEDYPKNTFEHGFDALRGKARDIRRRATTCGRIQRVEGKGMLNGE